MSGFQTKDKPKSQRNFYPINLDLNGRRVLFLGGGRDTLVEAKTLLEFGAHIEILSQRPVREIQDLALTHSHRLRLIKEDADFLESGAIQVSDYALVFAYSKFAASNETLWRVARESGVICSRKPVGGDFVVPSILRRGHLKVSVSTDGISPALESVLLSKIESESIGELDSYALFLDTAAEMVDGLPTPLTEIQRGKMLESVYDLSGRDDIRSALRRNNFAEASQLLRRHLEELLETHGA